MRAPPPPAAGAEAPVPVAVQGRHGPIRLKWHQLRTRYAEAPFRPANLSLGWRLGASLEIDIQACADERFVVAHDPTLGPSTTGRGRIARMPLAALGGFFHRDRDGAADPAAPVLSLADLVAALHAPPPAPSASLQLDLILPVGRALTDAAIADAAAAVAGLEHAIVVGAYDLAAARHLAAALPGARLGYDPMRAATRDSGLAREPARLVRHLKRRMDGVTIAFLRRDVVVAAEANGFPLVGRLLDLGIETDAWTVNPEVTDATLRRLVDAGVRQITTDAPAEIACRIARL